MEPTGDVRQVNRLHELVIVALRRQQNQRQPACKTQSYSRSCTTRSPAVKPSAVCRRREMVVRGRVTRRHQSAIATRAQLICGVMTLDRDHHHPLLQQSPASPLCEREALGCAIGPPCPPFRRKTTGTVLTSPMSQFTDARMRSNVGGLPMARAEAIAGDVPPPSCPYMRLRS